MILDFNTSQNQRLIIPELDTKFDTSLFEDLQKFKHYFLRRVKIENSEAIAKYKSNIINHRDSRSSVLMAVNEINSVYEQIDIWKTKVNEGIYGKLKFQEKDENLFYLFKYELFFNYLKLKRNIINEISRFLDVNYSRQLIDLNFKPLNTTPINKGTSYVEKDEKLSESLLTTDEACNLLNVGRTTLYNWSKKGIIKKHLLGRKVYYFKNEIHKKIKDT